MFASMVVVLAWAGWIGWREWPRWRAVREMRAAVEANEPGRFLDAIEQVDSLGVAEAAADEIAPLRRHPEPRVRMYAVMGRTVLRPRGPDEAKELIDLFDDPDEDINVRRAAAACLVLFGEHAREAVPSLREAYFEIGGDRRHAASFAMGLLPKEITGDFPGRQSHDFISMQDLLTLNPTPLEMGAFLVKITDTRRWYDAVLGRTAKKSP